MFVSTDLPYLKVSKVGVRWKGFWEKRIPLYSFWYPVVVIWCCLLEHWFLFDKPSWIPLVHQDFDSDIYYFWKKRFLGESSHLLSFSTCVIMLILQMGGRDCRNFIGNWYTFRRHIHIVFPCSFMWHQKFFYLYYYKVVL